MLLSTFGTVLAAVEHALPSLGARPKPLRVVVERLLGATPSLSALRLVQTDHSPPVDWLRVVEHSATSADDPTPISGDAWQPAEDHPWEGVPAAIIYDQSWSHGHLGDRRVDLRRIVADLGAPSFRSAYLIGPCIDEVASFHHVAERCGWNVVCAGSRDEEVGAARRVAASSEQGPIVLISRAVDMVRELEEDGHDVHVIDDLEPFLM